MAAIISHNYSLLSMTPSDINEHLPTLKTYAKECSVVAEFGVRGVVSTWAFLSGLCESQHANKKLICVDLEPASLDRVIELAKSEGIDVSFQQINSIHADLQDGVDLLFIDTWHIYGHLKRELAAHHAKTRKYIIMHDTTIDAEVGETIRGRGNVEKAAKDSGYTVQEVSTGLRPAIIEFLNDHPEWTIEKVYNNNNGLTILRRV